MCLGFEFQDGNGPVAGGGVHLGRGQSLALSLLQMLPDAGLGVFVGRVGYKGHIVEPGDALDGALVIFELVLIVRVAPFIGFHHEFERALGDITPADELQHVAAEGGLRGIELKTEPHLIHGEFESAGGGAGQHSGNVMVEHHDHIAHVGLFEGSTGDFLLKPAVDGLAPRIKLGGISDDGAGGFSVLALADLEARDDAPHFDFVILLGIFRHFQGRF